MRLLKIKKNPSYCMQITNKLKEKLMKNKKKKQRKVFGKKKTTDQLVIFDDVSGLAGNSKFVASF